MKKIFLICSGGFHLYNAYSYLNITIRYHKVPSPMMLLPKSLTGHPHSASRSSKSSGCWTHRRIWLCTSRTWLWLKTADVKHQDHKVHYKQVTLFSGLDYLLMLIDVCSCLLTFCWPSRPSALWLARASSLEKRLVLWLPKSQFSAPKTGWTIRQVGLNLLKFCQIRCTQNWMLHCYTPRWTSTSLGFFFHVPRLSQRVHRNRSASGWKGKSSPCHGQNWRAWFWGRSLAPPPGTGSRAQGGPHFGAKETPRGLRSPDCLQLMLVAGNNHQNLKVSRWNLRIKSLNTTL